MDLGLGHLRIEQDLRYLEGYGAEYGPAAGSDALRSAVAAREVVDPDWVAITTGASLGLVSVLGSLDPPYSILCPRPYYPAYPSVARLLGVQCIFYDLTRERGWLPDVEELTRLARADTRAILWNFPHNPTGSVAGPELVKEVCEWVGERGLVLVSDEVYADYVYGADPGDIRMLNSSQLVRLRSFSKAFGMPGERIGYVVASPDLLSRVARTHWSLGMCPPATGQAVALALLRRPRPDMAGEIQSALVRKRDLALDIVNQRGVAHAETPSGGFFLWIEIAGPAHTSRALAEDSRRVAGVLVMPGAAFGVDNPTYLRASFAVSDDELVDGFGALSRFLDPDAPRRSIVTHPDQKDGRAQWTIR